MSLCLAETDGEAAVESEGARVVASQGTQDVVVHVVSQGTQGIGVFVASVGSWGVVVRWAAAVRGGRMEAAPPMTNLCSVDHLHPDVSQKTVHQRVSRYIRDRLGRSP